MLRFRSYVFFTAATAIMGMALVTGGCSDDGVTIPSLGFDGSQAVAPMASSVSWSESPATVEDLGAVSLGALDLDSSMPNFQPYESIPFRAFDLEELRGLTGRDLHLGDRLTLKSGEVVTVGEFLAEFNKYEEVLSTKGMTFRDTRSIVTRVAVPTDRAALRAQSNLIDSEHSTFSVAPISLEDLWTSYAAELDPILASGEETERSNADNSGAIERQYSMSESWNYPIGLDQANAYLAGSFEMAGSLDEFRISAEASAGASIFGKNIDVVRATADVEAPRGGDVDVDLGVMIAGNMKYPPSTVGPAHWNRYTSYLDTDVQYDVDWTANMSYPVLGLVKVTGTLIVTGSVGYDFSMLVDDHAAGATFIATASVESDAQVGAAIDLGFKVAGVRISIAELSAGIGAELVLIENTLTTRGVVALKNLDQDWRRWTIDYDVSGTDELTLLSGSLYVWAKADFPKLLNSLDRKWKEKFFSWNGHVVSGSIFGDTGSIPVYDY